MKQQSLLLKHSFALVFFSLSYLFSISQTLPTPDWIHTFGSEISDRAYGIKVDPNGNILILGLFSKRIDLDAGVDSFMLYSPAGVNSLFIAKFDYTGAPIWAQQWDDPPTNFFHGSRYLEIDHKGNVYLSGILNRNFDAQPGPGSSPLTLIGSKDIFTIKLDKDGNFQWVKQVGGVGATVSRITINTDPWGNIYQIGSFSGTIDFDPGADSTVFTATPNRSGFFIQKMDPNGNLLWAKLIQNNENIESLDAIIDLDGNFLASGCFQDTLDIDPGPGVHNLISGNYKNLFLLKLDPRGNFIWVHQITGNTGFSGSVLKTDAANNIFLAGNYNGTIDLDPGPDSLIVTSYNNGRLLSTFVQKISDRGNFLWGGEIYVRNTPATLNTRTAIEKIEVDDAGYLYLQGYFEGEADFDLGPGTSFYTSSNVSNFSFVLNKYVAKYSTNGDLQWLGQIETPGLDISGWDLDPLNDIIFSGAVQFSGFDFDPGPDTLIIKPEYLYQDLFIGKWYQDNPCTTLGVQIDQSIDATCSPGLVTGYASGGSPPYSYTWNDDTTLSDTFLQITESGIYELTVVDSIGCSRSVSAVLSAPELYSAYDLRVNTTSTEFRSGFESYIWIDAFNDGCLPVDGTISLQLDPFLKYRDSSLSPDTIIGQTLIWNVEDMVVDSPHVRIWVKVEVSTVPLRGDILCLNTRITPQSAPTLKSAHNEDELCQIVVASYDPNDKRNNPQGICEEGFILPDEPITYTVRFQNVGDVDAINIFILDTLDIDLEKDSLKIVGKSHEPMITELLPGGVVKFRFDGIHLPDSTSDEPNSHGYVMFEIYPKKNLPSGTELTNRAGIYFDFNDPVITNTVLNTVIEVLPSLDTSFIQATGCDSYELNKRSYTHSGTYFQHLQAIGSCDSIIMLTLNLADLDTTVSVIGGSLQSNQISDPNAPVSYQWLDCDNNNSPIAGATQRQYTPERNGNYSLMISKGGCSKITSCIQVSTVGISSEFLASLKHYPNPTESELHIDLGESYRSVHIEISSSIGQLLGQFDFGPSEKLSLRLPKEAGLYFVKIIAEEKMAVIKVLKE